MTLFCDHCQNGLSQLGTNKFFCGKCGCTFSVTVTITRVSGPVRDAGKRELPRGDEEGDRGGP
jgi:hypothetical protein